jgi:hypothetical protein
MRFLQDRDDFGSIRNHNAIDFNWLGMMFSENCIALFGITLWWRADNSGRSGAAAVAKLTRRGERGDNRAGEGGPVRCTEAAGRAMAGRPVR